ncbi:predicted GPI-anchored protein 58 [Vigna unguiculata]|uniref:predicted GPI-anchored protein 58 n=1 Tax=Vigna unguiculata TaxID=3917 RepID=UPI0010171D1B|nr:predicted GPI-anchored protein 58 [Vigna unguiculata]
MAAAAAISSPATTATRRKQPSPSPPQQHRAASVFIAPRRTITKPETTASSSSPRARATRITHHRATPSARHCSVTTFTPENAGAKPAAAITRTAFHCRSTHPRWPPPTSAAPAPHTTAQPWQPPHFMCRTTARRHSTPLQQI